MTVRNRVRGVVSRFAVLLAAASAVGIAGVARAGIEGYYRLPAIRGDKVVFTCEGDLWSVPASGGMATRLTTHPAGEGLAQISPDGKTIAFTADYEGYTNVYTMPIDGGDPKRLTYTPGTVSAGWTTDGAGVLYRLRNTGRDSEEFLYSVPMAGGEGEKLPLGTASVVSYSPDGKYAAFNRWLFSQPWKNYKGGTAPQIWIEDIEKKSFHQLKTVEGINAFPMWIGDRIYFIAHRNGVINICSTTPEGTDLKQHTTYTDYDVRNPQTDGKRIIFQHGADLAIFDVASGETKKLDIEIASDRIRARVRMEDAAKTVDGFTLDEEGKHLAISSRGRIWASAVKANSRIVEVANDPRARTREPSYSPDGKKVVAISDATGEQELTIFDTAGKLPPRTLTHAGKGWIFDPEWSPDGSHIIYADLTMTLFVVDAETGAAKVVDKSENAEIRSYTFSPDGAWVAYTKQGDNELSELWLYQLSTGEKTRLSAGFTSDFAPAWDVGGKYLFFISTRHFDPTLDQTDFEFNVTHGEKICMILLAKDTKSPLLPGELLDDDEGDGKSPTTGPSGTNTAGGATQPSTMSSLDTTVTATGAVTLPATGPASKPTTKKSGKHAPKPLKIDLDGIERRVVELPMEPSNFGGLSSVEGKLLFFRTPVRGLLGGDDEDGPAETKLKSFDFKSKKVEDVLSGINSMTVSGDGKKIAVRKGNTIYVGAPTAAITSSEDKVELSRIPLVVDTQAEWAQIFNDAWRLQRDFYFAENMGGADWTAIKYKYEQLLPRLAHRSELNDVIGQMIGELGTSHTYVSGGDFNYRPPASMQTGLLGADVTIEKDTGLHRFTRIYKPEVWETDVPSPLAAPNAQVKDGDYLIAINGRELKPNEPVAERLVNLAGVQVQLTVASRADKSDARDIQVETLASDFELKYRDWCRRNREYVAEKSGGKLGYFHLPDMGGKGLSRFVAGFFPQFNRDGLVIDARDNHGGFVSQLMITRLAREVLSYMRPRRGAMEIYPSHTHQGYKAVLINQHAGSDGDIFPNAFQTRHLGPLIGTRTWGGVIGIRSDKPFIDGGMSTQPEFSWWSPTAGWAMENKGVTPDIEVVYTPEDYLANRDPQLDKAIEVLMAKIAEKAPPKPTRPPEPDHPGGK